MKFEKPREQIAKGSKRFVAIIHDWQLWADSRLILTPRPQKSPGQSRGFAHPIDSQEPDSALATSALKPVMPRSAPAV